MCTWSAAWRTTTHRHAAQVTVCGDAGAVQQVGGHLRPLRIGQHRVTGGGAQRAVPDRAPAAAAHAAARAVQRNAGGDRRGVEVAAQRGHVEPADRGVRRWLVQLRGAVPGGDDPLVGVLVEPARAHQVAQQATGVPAPRNLGDHRGAGRWMRRVARSCARCAAASNPARSATATSTRVTARATSACT